MLRAIVKGLGSLSRTFSGRTLICAVVLSPLGFVVHGKREALLLYGGLAGVVLLLVLVVWSWSRLST